MTVLGKIFVIVNLVLSVAVGALIVMTYVARTNWHTAYLEMEKQVKAAGANARTYQEERDQAKSSTVKAMADLVQQQQKHQADLQAKDNEIAQAGALLQAEQRKSRSLQGSLTLLQKGQENRQGEVDYLKKLVAQRDDKIRDMEKTVEDSHSKMVEAQIARNSEHERNNNLLARMEQMTKQLQKAQTSGAVAMAAPTGGKHNPPAEYVEGQVKAADQQSGLVTISLGTDQDVQKGNTLEVYRLKPEPAYVGTIEILASHATESVGKPVSRPLSPIRVGDTVASSIRR